MRLVTSLALGLTLLTSTVARAESGVFDGSRACSPAAVLPSPGVIPDSVAGFRFVRDAWLEAVELSSIELDRVVGDAHEAVAFRAERAGDDVLVRFDEPLRAGSVYLLRGGGCPFEATPEHRFEVIEAPAAPPLTLGAIEVSRLEARIFPGSVEPMRVVDVTLGPSPEVLASEELYEWSLGLTPDSELGPWSPVSSRRRTLSVRCSGAGDGRTGTVTPETSGLRAHGRAVWQSEPSLETPEISISIDCADEVYVDGPTGRELSEAEVEAWRAGRLDAGLPARPPPGADAGMDGEGPASSRACACRAAGASSTGSAAALIFGAGLAGVLVSRRQRRRRPSRA